MGNVRTYVTHEYEIIMLHTEMSCVQMCVTNENMMSDVHITYEIGVMSEPMLRKKIWCPVSDLCYIQNV